MQRESTLGRALWIALLIVLGGYVVADFARSPLLAPSGSAAVRPAELSLWSAAGEAGGETATVVQGAAAALELRGHATAIHRLPGGSSQAVAEYFARPYGGSPDLLVVTSATLADLARDRRDRLVPGAAEEAVLAQELLRQAVPIGLLESDPLTLAVAPDSAVEGSAALVSAVREAPSARLFAIADDTWSRVQLASLVDRAGVDGNVRFTVSRSGAETAQAIVTGSADVAVATRGSVHEDVDAGRLRELRWPFGGGQAPRSWVALVAPPGLPQDEVAEARRWVAGLYRDAGWRAQLRRAGRVPGGGPAELARLLRGAPARADHLEQLAQRVERG